MKKIVLTMLAAAAFGTLMAQDNNDAGRRGPRKMTPQEVTERMTKELDLNKDQQAKVLELNKAYEDVAGRPGMHRGQRGPRPEGMNQAPEGMNQKPKKTEKKVDGETSATARPQHPDRPGRPEMSEEQKKNMEKRMERRKEYDDKLKELLTPEQLEKYQQPRQPRGPRR